jgi:hypothetical protein
MARLTKIRKKLRHGKKCDKSDSDDANNTLRKEFALFDSGKKILIFGPSDPKGGPLCPKSKIFEVLGFGRKPSELLSYSIKTHADMLSIKVFSLRPI